jgi:hypothetical protein
MLLLLSVMEHAEDVNKNLKKIYITIRNHNSVDGVRINGLDDRRNVSVSNRVWKCSLTTVSKAGSGVHSASNSVCLSYLSSRVKQPVREANYSYLSAGKVLNEWSYNSILPCAFLAQGQI